MVEKVCGIDVHKDLLVATILDPQTQHKQTMNFKNSLDSIDQLQTWLKQNQCQTAAMESTSIYWIPLYDALEAAKIQVILANAYQVKAIPGRKTDQKDSEWLAHLQSAGLIRPSYIPPKQLRDLRELTRLRTKCVQTRTQNKNRVQKVLNRVNIRLRTVLSNIFGKAGTEIVEGLMQGKTVKTILKNTKNKRLQALSEEIEDAVQGTLGENDVFVLEQLTNAIKNIGEQIKQIDKRIATLTDKGVMAVLCSVPVVGEVFL
jgi:transposase